MGEGGKQHCRQGYVRLKRSAQRDCIPDSATTCSVQESKRDDLKDPLHEGCNLDRLNHRWKTSTSQAYFIPVASPQFEMNALMSY